jgi:hypothetical protein
MWIKKGFLSFMTCIFMDHNNRLDHILLYHIIPLNMHAVIGLVNRY